MLYLHRGAMHIDLYRALIDDTLAYLQGMLDQLPATPISLAKKAEASPPSPPLPKKKHIQTPTSLLVATNQKEEQNVKDSFIILDPPTVPSIQPTDKMKTLLLQIDPTLVLYNTPLSDLSAKQIKKEWKREIPTIPILFQGKPFRSFVTNIARAIEITFATSSCLVEVKEGKDWNLFLQSSNIRFIIAPDYLIFSTQELLPFYKEKPQQRVRYLGKVPLLLLPNLSLYYKNPHLKRSLWNVITHHLRPLF